MTTRAPSRPARTAVFACAAMLVSYLPFSAANALLGAIAATTGATTAQLQWVSDAFAVALAATVLCAGVLADLHGRRRVTRIGLGLTAVGGLIAFAGGSVPALWIGQAVAGVGGGAVMSASLGLIAATAPARDRAVSLWAAAVVGGLGLGPFLAALVAPAGWRAVFVPIVVLAVVVAALPSEEAAAPEGRGLDLPGQLTGAAGIALLTCGIVNGGNAGWADPWTVAALVAAAVALVAFVVVESRAAAPLLRLDLFASGGFTAAGLAAMAVLMAISGLLFVLSLLFTHQHVDDLGIAVRLGSLFAGNAVASVAASGLAARFGARAVLVGGLVVAGAGTATLMSVTAATGLAGFAWRLAFVGLGAGLVMATASVVALRSVPGRLAGMAGAANNAMRQLGAALGPAVLGSVLAARLHAGDDHLTVIHFCAAALVAVFVLTAVAVHRLTTTKGTTP
jgi:MFS family permease